MAKGDLRLDDRRPRRSARRSGADRELAAGIRKRYGEAIAAALVAWSHAPPRWGISDCAMALGNIDRQVTGRDTARGWRGRYYSQKGASRIMGRGGVVAMARQVARAQRWKPIARKFASIARDGDRGIALTTSGLACVIRYRGFWVGRHHGAGNVLASDREIIRAWSVL